MPARGQKRNASAMGSGNDCESFAGFERLPEASDSRVTYKRDIKSGFGLPPDGNARFANASCASLPSTISDVAKKLFYELLTRPQFLAPAAGISLNQIARDTGLESIELQGYASELEQLGKTRLTGSSTYVPADLPDDCVSSVNPGTSQSASTGPEPSGSQQTPFSGFALLPSASRSKRRKITSRYKIPMGDAKLASVACALLPPDVSDEARKLFYKLIPIACMLWSLLGWY